MAKLRDNETLQMMIEESQLSEMEIRFSVLQDQEVGITLEQFVELMYEIFKDMFTPAQIQLIFYKIDSGSTGYIDWNGFVTYVLAELKREHVLSIGVDPLIHTSPHVVKGPNQDFICRIDVIPQLQTNNRIDFNVYRYVTASQDGLLIVWTQNWEVLKYRNCCQRLNQLRRKKCPMILDMVCVPNLQTIAVSESDETIHFYDVVNANMDLLILITRTQSLITCMDYWFNETDLSESSLALGDSNGNVTVINFTDCLKEAFFGSLASKASTQQVDLSDILAGKYESANALRICPLHDDWVKMIRYVGNARSFISCSTDPEKSMVICETFRSTTKRIFNVVKGINCFDFSQSLNVIASGGVDRSVRIWNPYVTSKAIGILYGHNSPIICVMIIAEVEQIVSISRDKCIRVWDLKTQICLQTILDFTLKWSMSTFTATFHNQPRRIIILAAIQIIIIERFWEADGTDKSVFISHQSPLVGVLHSEPYENVVTISEDAVVTLWNIERGERLIQIPMCHTINYDSTDIPARVTAMALDESGRRLVTAGTDGFLKMWSMGSGGLLKIIEIPKRQDIHAILCYKQRIYFAGCSRQIFTCNDNFDADSVKSWPIRHSDDIMGLCSMEPNLLISVSWDGKVIIWLTDSGYVYVTLSLRRHYWHNIKAIVVPVERTNSAGSTKSDTVQLRQSYEKSKRASKELTFPNSPLSPSFKTRTRHITASKLILGLKIGKIPEPKSQFRDTVRDIESNVSISCVLCLSTRRNKPLIGNLIAADIKGIIQVWCTFQNGRLLGIFRSNVIAGHYTNCMATDSENKFLMTGSSDGYIRIWYIADYFSGHTVPKFVKIRDIVGFPFTLNNLRAVSTVTIQKLLNSHIDNSLYAADTMFPDLLSSYQGHLQRVVQISIIENLKIILTASTDKSVRLWTFSGHYLGTLGDPRGWSLSKLLEQPVDPSNRLAPADVRKVASATTLQVFTSGASPKWRKLREIILRIYARAVTRKRGSDISDLPDFARDMPKKPVKKFSVASSQQKMQEKMLTELGPPLGNYFVFKKASGTKLTVQSLLDNKERQVTILHTFMEPQELTALTLDAALPLLDSHRHGSRLKNLWLVFLVIWKLV